MVPSVTASVSAETSITAIVHVASAAQVDAVAYPEVSMLVIVSAA